MRLGSSFQAGLIPWNAPLARNADECIRDRSSPSFADYWRGLKLQARVLNALMIRELMMRYGRGNIGFLWLIVEPMILCAGVIGLRWMIQEHQEHGVPLVALLLSGYMPLTLWRHLTNRGIFLLRRNMGMLYHRNGAVKPLILLGLPKAYNA
jgi:ABC-type polysaccharide/polyol phosphate export permease